MKDKIIVELDGPLFELLKMRTQLLLRGNEELSTEVIITDRDKVIIKSFFEDAKTEVINALALADVAESYPEGAFIYQLSGRQKKNKLYKLSNILKKAFEEYLLMRWFDSIGIIDVSQYRQILFENALRDFRNNTTKKAFVVPKFRPYF